jgi:hypothetical protein
MAHIIAFLIIGVVKMIKWTLVKTRLFIVAIPAVAALILFKDWYGANALLADGIGFSLIVGVGASWIVTLVRYTKTRKHNRELVLDWAYERYGKPIVLTRKTQES